MAKKAEVEVSGSIVDRLNSKYGKGTIIGGTLAPEKVESVSTGSLTLDIATGINGNPRGKLIEMFGPESSGKSTLSLHFTANFQKAGDKVLLVDFEQSFDKRYARNLGVNVDELLIAQPDNMEDGWNLIFDAVLSKEFGLIVLDSQTAMPPKAALEGEIGDPKMALQARINSDALRKIKPKLISSGTTIVAISQLRTAIGSYGDPDKPSGGNAFKFYSDIRYKVSKSLDKVNGLNKTVVDVIKNKCAPPFGKAEFDIVWGEGVDKLGEIIDLSVENKEISKAGGWYTVGEDKYQIGKLKEFLGDNPEFLEELENKIKNVALAV